MLIIQALRLYRYFVLMESNFDREQAAIKNGMGFGVNWRELAQMWHFSVINFPVTKSKIFEPGLKSHEKRIQKESKKAGLKWEKVKLSIEK